MCNFKKAATKCASRSTELPYLIVRRRWRWNFQSQSLPLTEDDNGVTHYAKDRATTYGYGHHLELIIDIPLPLVRPGHPCILFLMTSWLGNAFRITSHSWRESTDHNSIPLTEPGPEIPILWCFSSLSVCKRWWINSRVIDNSLRDDGHMTLL